MGENAAMPPHEVEDLRVHPDLSRWDGDLDALRARLLNEKYACSLQTLRAAHAAGDLAIQGTLASDPEALPAYNALRKDFDTTITEMVKTSEYGDELEINHISEFEVRNNEVVTDKGQPFTEMIWCGIEKARQAAEAGDTNMWVQMRRDQSDLYSANRVNMMASGRLPCNTRAVVSVEPIEAIAKHGAEYWTRRDKGFYYIPGMAIIQLYHWDGVKMITGTFSVDMSDKQTWLQTLKEFGVEIPPEESTEKWVTYGLEATLTAEQALQLPHTLRARYYENRGCTKQRLSIDEFLTAHRAQLDQDFNKLYLPLSQSLASGTKHRVIDLFVRGLLQNVASLKPELRVKLQRIQSAQHFGDDDARTIEPLIRYATVEALRSSLLRRLGRTAVATELSVAPATANQVMATGGGQLSYEDLVLLRVANVNEGAAAGRSYGGACVEDITVSNGNKKPDDSSSEARNAQEAFGGRATQDKKVNKACEYRFTGCYCCPYDFEGNPLDQPVEVTAHRNAKGDARCLRPGCGAQIDASGHVVSKGGIYLKAQAKQLAKAMLKRNLAAQSLDVELPTAETKEGSGLEQISPSVQSQFVLAA